MMEMRSGRSDRFPTADSPRNLLRSSLGMSSITESTASRSDERGPNPSSELWIGGALAGVIDCETPGIVLLIPPRSMPVSGHQKYPGVLAAADVFTASTTFWVMESIRLDLGYAPYVHP
jgi:hypothetical protein